MTRLSQDLALWIGTKRLTMPNNMIVLEASGPCAAMSALVLVVFQDSVLFLPGKRFSYIQLSN